MDVVKFAPTGDQLHELSLAAERLNEKKMQSNFMHTDIVRSSEDAVEEKVKLLHGSIFGKPLIKFEIVRYGMGRRNRT